MKLPIQKTALVLLVIFIQACGTAHIQSNTVSEDLSKNTSAYISEVDIQSKEQNGDSLAMNRTIEVYAEEKLTSLITSSNYSLLKSPVEANSTSLAFKINLNIIYGSRAARYWAGFGAGKGSVKSLLEVTDSETGTIKYSSSGESDLTMGAFGGSMESVIKQNIDKLINGYLTSLK